MNFDWKNHKSPLYIRMAKLPLGSIRPRGWLEEQMRRNADGMGGHLDELEPNMIGLPYVQNVVETKLGSHLQAGWTAEISGTYWMAFIQLAFSLGDPELIAKAERWVNGVLAKQEPDGYMGAYRPEDNRLEDYNAWGTNWALRGLLSFYEATGREDVLEAVHKDLLWFCKNWAGDQKTPYAGLSILESMIVCYGYTGDRRLLDFSLDYLDWLERDPTWPNAPSDFLSDTFDYNSSHTVAYGDAVRMPAAVYCANGDERLLRAAINGLEKAFAHIMQPTGAPSSNAEYLSPVGGSAETEYCNFATFNFTYSWMSMATGDPIWGDRMERITYNGAQGARKKDERAIAYMSAPNQYFAVSDSNMYFHHDMQTYSPCYSTACCPAQSIRQMPEFLRGSCLCDEDGGLYFLVYAPSVLQFDGFSAEIDTLYPFRDTVQIKLLADCDDRKLSFRIPEWCENAEVLVNGQAMAGDKAPQSFFAVERSWKAGDVVTLRFPMRVRIEKLDDSDLMGNYPMVISYGPLVYALPIETEWIEIPGHPITPLPDGWSWFEARPKICAGGEYLWYDTIDWNVAIDEHLPPEAVRVEEIEPEGYVWENPPIRLHVPLYKAKYSFPTYAGRNLEPYEKPIAVQGEAQERELVPYGCTNLRMTFLYRAKL